MPLLVRGPHIKANLSVVTISGNTDIAPTILDLAGGPDAVNPMMDGRSLLPLLLTRDALAAVDGSRDSSRLRSVVGRETYLIEYNALGNIVRGAPKHHHLVDSTHSNQYRGIRVINATHNLLLAEFTNQSDWDFEDDAGIFTEYFNLTMDPWQLTNLAFPGSKAARTHAADIGELRKRLRALWTCKAESCV